MKPIKPIAWRRRAMPHPEKITDAFVTVDHDGGIRMVVGGVVVPRVAAAITPTSHRCESLEPQIHLPRLRFAEWIAAVLKPGIGR